MLAVHSGSQPYAIASHHLALGGTDESEPFFIWYVASVKN